MDALYSTSADAWGVLPSPGAEALSPGECLTRVCPRRAYPTGEQEHRSRVVQNVVPLTPALGMESHTSPLPAVLPFRGAAAHLPCYNMSPSSGGLSQLPVSAC